MLFRKVEAEIKKWIHEPKRALLVKGARQVGKTYIIRKCFADAGADYIEINLLKNPELIPVLEQSASASDLAIGLSLATGKTPVRGKTFIFIDEIQEYKEIVTKIKFLVDEGAFYFCLSGSLLGVALRNISSAPVGYMQELTMFPLDFEEFLYAGNVRPEVVASLRECYERLEPVSDYINTKMMAMYRRYLVVGGMPAAVQEFVSTGDMNAVMNIQRDIISQYKLDFTKYEDENKRLLLTNLYESIPSQLLKQNRRFNYSDIKKGLRFEQAEESFLWLTNAGVAYPVYNATEPRVALYQNRKSSLLKLYLSDVGLLTCLYGEGAKLKLLTGDKNLNAGGIFENAVAQELAAHGYQGYYYNSHKLGELDFVVEHDGAVLPLEVKSGKDYYVHSAINNVLANKEFDIPFAYVLADCNVEVKDNIIYLPIYLLMFLSEQKALPILDPLF